MASAALHSLIANLKMARQTIVWLVHAKSSKSSPASCRMADD
jgi:hypothetical protein